GTDSLTPRRSTCVGPLPGGEGKAGGTPALRGRTYLWDPVRGVCRRLEISHSMLSHLSKEHSGMAAHEIADRIRARKLKRMFWGVLQKFTQTIWWQAGLKDFNEEEWKACAQWTENNGTRCARKNGPFYALNEDKISLREDPYSQHWPGTDVL